MQPGPSGSRLLDRPRGARCSFRSNQGVIEAAARMAPGIVECDVTFTSRHWVPPRANDGTPQTNILLTIWQDRHQDVTPATFDAMESAPAAAGMPHLRAGLAEFKSLRGKRDAFIAARTAGVPGGTAQWRNTLQRARHAAHAGESIEQPAQRRQATTELKFGDAESVERVFGSRRSTAEASGRTAARSVRPRMHGAVVNRTTCCIGPPHAYAGRRDSGADTTRPDKSC